MQSRLNCISSVAVIATCLFVSPNASAMGSYIKGKILKNLDHPAAKMDTAIFDGRDFVKGVPFPKIRSYYVGFMDKVNRAAREWKKAPSNQKSSATAKAIFQQLQKKSRWAVAMSKAFPPLEKAWNAEQIAAGTMRAAEKKLAAEAAEKHKALCRTFGKPTIFNSQLRQPMHRMVDILRGASLSLATPESVAKHKAAMEAVAVECAKPEYKGSTLFTNKCYWMVGQRVDIERKDPKNWCAVASKRQELIVKAVTNHVTRMNKRVADDNSMVKRIATKDGWVSLEGFRTYEAVTTFTDEDRKKLLSRIGPLFAAAGIKDTSTLPIWDTYKRNKAAIKAKIDELAPTWKNPNNDGKDYSVKLAKKQVKKAFKRAKRVKGFLSRKTYKIIKNGVGIPLRRTKPGYVQYQRPGEPWCQLRSYTLTEPYAGGGRYQKAGGVRFGYTRWQKCK